MKKKKQICNHREKGLIWAGRFDWYKCSICGKEIRMTTKPETKDQKKAGNVTATYLVIKYFDDHYEKTVGRGLSFKEAKKLEHSFDPGEYVSYGTKQE